MDAAGDSDGAGPAQPQRHGHRPYLGPAQALYLARHLFGIHPAPAPAAPAQTSPSSAQTDAPDHASSDPSCRELPSYDDRNFLVSGYAWGLDGPSDEGGHDPSASSTSSTNGPGRGRAVRVVVKVHSTQDSGRTEQLQAMDQAMVRLGSRGVATNTSLQPLPSAASGPQSSSLASAPGPNAAPGAEEEGFVPTLLAARPPPDPAGQAASSSLGGTSTIGADPPAAGGAEATDAASPGPLSGWALLPCTCDPAREAVQGAAGEEASVGTGGGGAGSRAGGGRDGHGCHWHVVRCLSFVPGATLSSVKTLTPALCRSLGELMGRVTLALEGWAPPALQRAGHDWNPESGAAVLRRLVPGLDAFDQERKSLLLAVASELEAAAPRLRAAPRQVCHADANDDNVLLSPDGASVVGLIDFGDMGSMPRVCEVAIAMLYTMLLADNRSYGRTSTAAAGGTAEQGPEAQEEEAEEATLRRLLEAAGQLLSGYLSLVPLSPPELALLPLLLRGRLAQSLALGAASVEADPGNAGYLLATQRPGWRLIRLLAPGRVAGEEQLLGWLRGAEGGGSRVSIEHVATRCL